MMVILHAPTEDALARARSNAKNLKAAEPDATVEIVANAGGVRAAIATPDPDTDDALRLCGNTLRTASIEPPATLVVVDAAVAHIARRQAAGWIYIRA